MSWRLLSWLKRRLINIVIEVNKAEEEALDLGTVDINRATKEEIIDRLKKVRERNPDANGVFKHQKREAVVAEVMQVLGQENGQIFRGDPSYRPQPVNVNGRSIN